MNPTDTKSTSGGSKSTDFQPLTRNPQGNVVGGLQPNSTSLQPVAPANGSNVFNQPGVNAQAFPQTTSLSVRSISNGVPVSATNNQAAQATKSSPVSLILIVFIVSAGVLLFLVKTAKSKAKVSETITDKTVPDSTAVIPKPKKKKKTKSHKKFTKRK